MRWALIMDRANKTAVELTAPPERNGNTHPWKYRLQPLWQGVGEGARHGQRKDHIDEHGGGGLSTKVVHPDQRSMSWVCKVGSERGTVGNISSPGLVLST